MATTQLLVRTTMQRIGDPGRCLIDVNRQLCTQIFVGQFVTILIAVLDLDQNELHVATAGHYPPLLGNGSSFSPLKVEPELVLGVDPSSQYRTETFDLPPDAGLLMYTDGLLDVEAPGGKRFGKENLRKTLSGSFNSPQEIVDRIQRAVDQFRNHKELTDDLTLVAVQLTERPALALQHSG
jgi:sigma-B regulation protein RsbU (phosphoserine phosphatase)